MLTLAQVDAGAIKSTAEVTKDLIGDSVLLLAGVVLVVLCIAFMWAYAKWRAPHLERMKDKDVAEETQRAIQAQAMKEGTQAAERITLTLSERLDASISRAEEHAATLATIVRHKNTN